MAKTMGAAAKDKGRNDQRQGSRGSQSRRTDRTSQGEGSGGTRASSLAIEEWAIERVIPYDKNPRVNDSAVDAVARSILEFGFRQPIVVDEKGVVIVGHTRLKAAKKLGLATVPVHVASMTHAQAKAYRIADNQTATIAEWDKELLPIEILELKEMDFDLELLGFDKLELDNLLRLDNEGLCDPDEVPEVPADPITKPGDLWILGEHRLLCGDSTKAEDVAKVLGGAKPFLMVTDPPYGVEYDPMFRERALGAAVRRTGTVENDNRSSWLDAWKLSPTDVCYVWHADKFALDVGIDLRSAGYEIRATIIWKKAHLPFGQGHYSFQHEPCWYAVKSGSTSKWCGDRSQSTVWDIALRDATGETRHGTQKPVECMARPVRNHGDKLDDVYDPFLGSGTTLIACEQLNRRCYAIEISPQYVDVAVKRWEQFTGKTAHRE